MVLASSLTILPLFHPPATSLQDIGHRERAVTCTVNNFSIEYGPACRDLSAAIQKPLAQDVDMIKSKLVTPGGIKEGAKVQIAPGKVRISRAAPLPPGAALSALFEVERGEHVSCRCRIGVAHPDLLRELWLE